MIGNGLHHGILLRRCRRNKDRRRFRKFRLLDSFVHLRLRHDFAVRRLGRIHRHHVGLQRISGHCFGAVRHLACRLFGSRSRFVHHGRLGFGGSFFIAQILQEMRPDHECQSKHDNHDRHSLALGFGFFFGNRLHLCRTHGRLGKETCKLRSAFCAVPVQHALRIEAELAANGIEVATEVSFHRESLPIAVFDKGNVLGCEPRHRCEVLHGHPASLAGTCQVSAEAFVGPFIFNRIRRYRHTSTFNFPSISSVRATGSPTTL